MSHLYFEDAGKSISKTYINNLSKNNLGLSYLKSTVKTNKINSNSGIKLYFIKSIVKFLKVVFCLLFFDEGSIISTNNNYRTWRGTREDIYSNIGIENILKNLLLVVSYNEVIHLKIVYENINEKNFLNFMEEIYEKTSKRSDKRFAIIMDNLSIH